MIEWLESIGGETWTLVLIVCAGLFVISVLILLVGSDAKPKVMCICPSCGAFGYPKIVIPGSSVTVIVLFVFVIVPAIFYALFRQMGTRRECPLCGNEGMVPADSPKGLQLQKEHHRTASADPAKPPL